MDHAAELDSSRCPICSKPNRCAMADGQPATACWCYSATINDDVMERVPEEARGVVCVCARCANHAPSDQGARG